MIQCDMLTLKSTRHLHSFHSIPLNSEFCMAFQTKRIFFPSRNHAHNISEMESSFIQLKMDLKQHCPSIEESLIYEDTKSWRFQHT